METQNTENWLDDCFGNIEEVNNNIAKEREEKAVEESRTKKCGKCNGKGRIGHYHYVANGECFDCEGTGKIYK